MAYSGFPETYQNGYPQNNYMQYGYGYNPTQYTATIQQQNQQLQQQSQQNNSTIIWVQGEAGAKAYPLAPNNKILLMDSEAPVLYVKSVNASGIPDPLIIYDLVERKDQPVQNVKDESNDRIKNIEIRLEKIENKIQSNNNVSKQRRERNG